eukprot:GHVU01177102.1.p1 GENE.GHVU01177102.1~~GHVU01177102.1.p1  ORF type:complete len:132 (+),score=2.93 GHVU01177102.1:146-541(+)
MRLYSGESFPFEGSASFLPRIPVKHPNRNYCSAMLTSNAPVSFECALYCNRRPRSDRVVRGAPVEWLHFHMVSRLPSACHCCNVAGERIDRFGAIRHDRFIPRFRVDSNEFGITYSSIFCNVCESNRKCGG